MPNIRNLLIDLGDVLYAIDVQHTLDRWQQMASKKEGVGFTKEDQHHLFSLLDKGQIEIRDFADELIRDFHLQAEAQEVIQAWKELLVGVIPGRIQAIEKLSKQYRLALLSNTNAYHYSVYKDECAPMFRHFEHLFLSFEMGMRKPDREIFESALTLANWQADETLFLDDSQNNIIGGQAVGLQTFRIAQYSDFDRMCEQYLRV